MDTFPETHQFPCFGKGSMNMPSMYHNYKKVYGKEKKKMIMRGSFYGLWDLNANHAKLGNMNDSSYYIVTWEKIVLEVIHIQ